MTTNIVNLNNTTFRPSLRGWFLPLHFDDRYYISLCGEIISYARSTPRIIKPFRNADGYLQVQIGRKKYYIHRLVADTFLAPPQAYQTVIDHIDFSRANNVFTNLRWETRAVNAGRKRPPV